MTWAQWLTFTAAALMLLGLGRWAWRSVGSAGGGEPAQAAAVVANAVAMGDQTIEVPMSEGDRASIMAVLATMRDQEPVSAAGVLRMARGLTSTSSPACGRGSDSGD